MASFTREKSRQKCILFFLGILVILGLILVKPTTIAAAELDYTFTYDDTLDGYLITGYTGTDTKPQLPDTYNSKTVVGVGESAFSGNSIIVEIDIPDSYVVIQSYAFKKCENLEKLTIGASVTDVMYDAFSGSTNFKTLIIDSSDVTFYEDSLIRSYIETLIFSDEVTAVSDYAKDYSSMPYLKNIVIGNFVTEIPENIFSDCTKVESLTIGNRVKTIGKSAFSGCTALTTVTMGESVETISDYAFSGCSSIEEMVLGSEVTVLGDMVFDGCTSLKSLTVNSAYEVGSFCFEDVALDTLIIGDDATELPSTCPDAKKVIIGAFITEIPEGAFEDCTSLESITFPEGLKKIGGDAFNGCSSLKELNFSEGLEEIGYYAFYQCTSLETVVLPDSLKVLGQQSFSGAGVKTFSIGEGVSEVESYVLEGCDNLYQLIVEGKDTIIDGIFGATGDEAQKKVTIVAPQDSLAAEAALASNFRCTDSTEVSIQCRTTTMYVTETRIMELYNDDGSAKWATTDEGILSVDEYGFITANAVGDATITVNVNGTTYSYDFKVIERTTENVLSVVFEYYVTEDMTDYEKVLAANRWIGDNAVYDHNEECDSRYNMNGIFKYGLAVCDGYTWAFREIMNRCGITNVRVLSPHMAGDSGHSWNLVRIGGEWYHIDTCWNEGEMTYCLLTDEEISISHELPSYYPKATCETINKTVISSKITYELFDDNATNSDNPIGYSTEMDEPIVLAAPSRYGYHFLGWYTDVKFKNKVTEIIQGKGAITLYAKWEEHSYQPEVKTESTCGKSGEMLYTCECGDYYTEDIKPTGNHKYSCQIISEPSCYTYGEAVYTCECGNYYYDEIAPYMEHIYETTELKQAICGSGGEIKHYCTRCGESYIEYTSATGKHTYTTTTEKAKASENGKIVTSCIECGHVSSTTTIYKIKTVKLSKTEYVYSGKNCKPKITVKDSNGKTISSSHYTVTYSKNKSVGTATVTIKFKGSRYSGTIKKTFKIVPKATIISKLTKKSKGFKVNIKKQKTQTTGYEIQYSTKKNLKNAKTVRIASKTTSKTITGLSAKKKYYVRVRTYKTVNGKRIYSEWSKTESVTTKK